ncbi:DarT ssDNA thymidine ADP-ribosyltransferase family protein [Leptolyngbya sp. NIES-2104]|uniref:DarT ssDNA thymidine ADP-ribosyltransferase family protein n=1 Tax=Leptolyngbya sp. NIES-2104 TaxID=1552121 RepID=UPI0006EC64C7|nr:DarT ssDNA thymidine ADP-ribosyltransferase family protein [Leptolyngbya sp. NIES-2104]GAP98922.1 hypothetical protein NIES2104_54780 [Leptolyngbya sp. NIES-2104]
MPHPHALAIHRICNERGINTLIHFTRIQNLRSILQQGLLGRYLLEQLPVEHQPVFNDSKRLDGCRQAICLSISFPNYRMFYKYNHNNPSNWVVLLLKASVLWELDCAFCVENAASTRISNSLIETRKQAQSLLQMFSDYERIQRQDLHIPINYPTHPQSEVLVLEAIPTHYLSAVHFYNEFVGRQWLTTNIGILSEPYLRNSDSQFFYSSQQYFKPRQDWRTWQSHYANVGSSQADTSVPNEISF